ncbi:7528_t:CDS:2, partial [Dentiscutata heterogama]
IDSPCSFQRFIIAMQSLLRVKIVPPISRGKDQDVNVLTNIDLIYDYFEVLPKYKLRCRICSQCYLAILTRVDDLRQHLRKEHKEAFEELSLKYFLRDYAYLHYNWATGKHDYASATEFLTKYEHLFLYYEIFYYNLSKIDSSWSIQRLMMAAHLLRVKLYSPPLMSVIEEEICNNQ